MTFLRRALLVTGFLGAVLLAPSASAQNGSDVLDEIVAVVGDQIVLRSDVNGLVTAIMQQQNVPYSEDLWNQALGEIIDQNVLVAEAKRDTTIQVTEDQVSQMLDQRIEVMTQQVGGQQRLEELYGKSVLQIKADLRDEFRERLQAEELQRRKLRAIRITPSEVRAWFDRIPSDSLPTLPEIVRVAHIVRYPAVSEEAETEARQIISSIRDSIVTAGATLESMAQRFSDDPGSAANGGAYENYRLAELDPDFAAVAARADVGELSQIFRSSFGYHILRVDDRRGDVVDFTHVLIAVDDTKADPSEAVAYLNTVRDSILTQDVPFAIMARRHSEETASAQGGGRVLDPRSGARDLPLAALGASWQRTLDTLEVGQISKPAEAELLDGRRAVHIVQLQKRVPAHRVNIETDYERIEEIALQEKQQRILREWLDALREEVYIDIRGEARSFSLARF